MTPTHRRALRRRREEMRKCDRGKRGESLERWQRPTNADRRSTSKELFSEALHAIVAVILCKALLACHINKVRSFSGSVSPFLWQIQNVLLKPVWKMSCLSAKRGTEDDWKKNSGSSSAEINSKQRAPAEMTCAWERSVTLIFFTMNTPCCISQRGLVVV